MIKLEVQFFWKNPKTYWAAVKKNIRNFRACRIKKRRIGMRICRHAKECWNKGRFIFLKFEVNLLILVLYIYILSLIALRFSNSFWSWWTYHLLLLFPYLYFIGQPPFTRDQLLVERLLLLLKMFHWKFCLCLLYKYIFNQWNFRRKYNNIFIWIQDMAWKKHETCLLLVT